jgi:hypothetical protein
MRNLKKKIAGKKAQIHLRLNILRDSLIAHSTMNSRV